MSDSLEDAIAKLRAETAAVDQALATAAQTAHDAGRSREEFTTRAGEVWDELFETEEAKAERAERQRKAWADWLAACDSPEYIAEQKAREAADKAARETARAARRYPVLMPAKRLGKVLCVADDGTVTRGRFQAHGAGETGVYIPEERPAVVTFTCTCEACPEQYDATIAGEKVGYVRLRHGMMRVDYPECGGEAVYEATPWGDGQFQVDERDDYLDRARAALYERWLEDNR